MQFPSPLLEGRLLRRYQRFLADVELADGRAVTAHTPNTGAMLGCNLPGSRVWLSDSGNAARKYPLTLEIVEAAPGLPVGVNTGLANGLAREAIETGVVAALGGYDTLRGEVRYGRENSRIDLLLSAAGRPDCYVEVKNVTLAEDGTALFPDAVTLRGAKHLRELAAMAREGRRAVIFYCVQRGDAAAMAPADRIDPAYGRALREALAAGVEALAYRAEVTPAGIVLARELPVSV
jgi:sugar fermentation stimulation protein A